MEITRTPDTDGNTGAYYDGYNKHWKIDLYYIAGKYIIMSIHV